MKDLVPANPMIRRGRPVLVAGLLLGVVACSGGTDGEPLVSVHVWVKCEIPPDDALAMLGPEWIVEKGRQEASTRDGPWKASAVRSVVGEGAAETELTVVSTFDRAATGRRPPLTVHSPSSSRA